MTLESLLTLLAGGLGVFILNMYINWKKSKREEKKDAVGAWRDIADHGNKRIEKLEDRVKRLENLMLEKDHYIKQLEHVILQNGLQLPIKQEKELLP